jgi:hypothetical protein
MPTQPFVECAVLKEKRVSHAPKPFPLFPYFVGRYDIEGINLPYRAVILIKVTHKGVNLMKISLFVQANEAVMLLYYRKRPQPYLSRLKMKLKERHKIGSKYY